MSTAIALSRPAAAPRPAALCLCLAALFACEVLALTLRFDTESLHGDTRWWAAWVGEAHFLPQLLATMAVAFALFGGSILRTAWAGFAEQCRATHSVWPGLAVHVAALIAFTLCSDRLLSDRNAGTAVFLAWVATGIVMVAGLCAAVAPRPARAGLLRALGRPFLVAGGLAGVLGFAAGRFAEPLWTSLAGSTLSAAHAMLELAFTRTIRDDANRVLGANAFSVQIAPSCSGYEGLGLVLAFTILFLVLKREELRFPRAIALIPLGLFAAWSMNVLRIAGLIALGASGWHDVARGGFHSQAGWLGFLGVAFALVSLGRHRAFAKSESRMHATVNPAVPYLAPLIALVGCSMATAAFSDGRFDPLYGLRIAAVGAVLLTVRGVGNAIGCPSRPSWHALVIGAAVYAVWLALAPAAPTEPSPIPSSLEAMSAGGAAVWLIARVLGAVVIVPIAEELAFRGFLLRKLQASEFDSVSPRRWSWPAVAGSSICFGLLHPGWWLAGILAGVLYSAAYHRRGRVADAILAHATTNALLAAHVMITGQWWLW
ncbi:MAG: exosortase E/protease, VPEID-CTERM system [Gemmataceae bacterium]